MHLFSKAGSDSLHSISPQLLFEIFKQPLTAHRHISPGGLEVPGAPWIGNLLARLASILHQQMDLFRWVTTEYALHIADIGLVHADQQIVICIVATGQLPGSVAGTGDSMLRQFPLGRWIDRIADFFPTGSS